MNTVITIFAMVAAGAAVRYAPEVAWPLLAHIGSAAIYVAIHQLHQKID